MGEEGWRDVGGGGLESLEGEGRCEGRRRAVEGSCSRVCILYWGLFGGSGLGEGFGIKGNQKQGVKCNKKAFFIANPFDPPMDMIFE